MSTAALLDRAAAPAPIDRSGRDGVAAVLPFVAGLAPFAAVIGATAAAHGDVVAGWTGSWLIYGGSAHLATLRTLDEGTVVLAVVTGLLINARLLVYSAGLALQWRDQPLWFRLAGAAMVVDPTFVVAEAGRARRISLAAERRFFLSAGLALGAGWSFFMAVGAIAGDHLAASHLEVAVPLCLVPLVAPRLRDAGSRAVVAAAAVVALATSGWSAGTGVLAAIAVGCAVGAVTARRSEARL